MKRILIIFFAALAMAFLCGKTALAESVDYGADRIAEALPEQAREILDDAEISPDNSGAMGITFGGVLAEVFNWVKHKASAPLGLFCSLCGVILLCVIAQSLSETGQLKGVFSVVGVLCGAGISAAAVSGVLNETLGVLSSAADFMMVFIPAFTGLAAVLGHVSTAAAVNSVVLAATQLFSQLAVNFLAPLCGTILGVSAAGAADPQMKLEKLGEIIKKFVIWGLTLIMTVFMSVLSAQTLVAASADNAAIKAAKFVVSQGVPFIGSTISDSVNMFSGGIMAMKGSVGTYGMIAAAVIIIPTLIGLTCYRLALYCAQTVAELFGLKELAALFKSCCSVMTIILAVTVCFLLLNTLAVFLMLAITNIT
ncbi:MAG: stage III sporulation protein AE [Oscillospiraceae bacterium]|nr:stage III sporulation protein AE [Oscillospiraceae bacterium]